MCSDCLKIGISGWEPCFFVTLLIIRKNFMTAGLRLAKPLCSPDKRFECKQRRV